jgi:ketosteroid isomerase-like protein
MYAGAAAQGDIQKLVDTEHSFAQMAADHGTRSAFLEYMAIDSLVFTPDRTNGKPFWTARGESASLLSWAPNFADVSSTGILGYTTGNWEFRPKGKDDAPTAFGDFITVWLRQPDGKYRFVVDIGVGHAKPEKYSTDWSSPAPTGNGDSTKSGSAIDFANMFFKTAIDSGLARAYKAYASDSIRAYREDKLPILGKKAFLSAIKDDRAQYGFAKRSAVFEGGDIAYVTDSYTKSTGGKVIEKGNFLQIWKSAAGRWQIVLEIFKPVQP